LKESKAKNQTGKGAKINGYKYNFSGGLITNCINIQGPNQKYHLKLQNDVVSLNTVDCLLQKTLRAAGRETFATAKALICFNQGGMFHG
jgi:hypothetical protein